MSTPRTKRQFAGASADPSQRQITSFFNARTPAESAATEAEKPLQPVLPSTVQANLLSVGMRVRKSVPEGYKTVGTSAFKLWTDNAPVNTTKTTARAPTKGASRELLPFCGINRVGGLDTQPEFEREDDVPDIDAIPELTMSQESNESAESYDGSRKRIFYEEEDELVESRAMDVQNNSRIMAIPVSRKGAGLRGFVPDNRNSGSDFEEADFLVDPEMDMTN
ncbi:ribonucleotide reductase inhibitor [Fusarium sporotrichioides]|uniref:Ribonucleotide reductase inhibitor n=1 Tax=Fusarium sporotrichioides TaxID=5514 RepID=A0A395SSZ7_FUSSP|nr:ribonucleotide reductase inhibitor [Fusarium sporotrichioides]